MKKVLYSVLFVGTFAAIFSCQKEDYNVSDLQTVDKLTVQTQTQSPNFKTASPADAEVDSCDWGIEAVGSNVADCIQAPIPGFPTNLAQTKVTVNVFGTPTGTSTLSFFVNEGQTVIPLIPMSPPGQIRVKGVSGSIVFEGSAKVVITVQTPNGVNPPGTNICTFTPNRSNKGCRKGLFTTKTVPFGIGQNCSVSFPH